MISSRDDRDGNDMNYPWGGGVACRGSDLSARLRQVVRCLTAHPEVRVAPSLPFQRERHLGGDRGAPVQHARQRRPRASEPSRCPGHGQAALLLCTLPERFPPDGGIRHCIHTLALRAAPRHGAQAVHLGHRDAALNTATASRNGASLYTARRWRCPLPRQSDRRARRGAQPSPSRHAGRRRAGHPPGRGDAAPAAIELPRGCRRRRPRPLPPPPAQVARSDWPLPLRLILPQQAADCAPCGSSRPPPPAPDVLRNLLVR